MTQAFGEWDAPATDDAVWIDAPTDLECTHCRERFVEGDSGAVWPTGFAAHRECSLRAAIGGVGHLVNHARYCTSELGPDAGLSYRESARLVWLHFTTGYHVTEAELAELRK